MDGSIILLLIVVVIVGILVFVGISMSQKRKHTSFDKEKYQTNWLSIENSLQQDNPASYKTAIMDADKLLGHAMAEMGIRGNTMGERLKNSGSRFSDINAVWTAHKVRNKIAHEVDYQVSYKQAQQSLRIFRKALRDLEAI